MPPKKKSKGRGRAERTRSQRRPEHDVDAVVAELKRLGSKAARDGMARYAIPSDKAFGVSVGTLQKMARRLGRNHALALALWETGWYEARMLACFLDEPDRVTAAQMDRWCADFDNWAVCDTACFALFDRTLHAWDKVEQWSKRSGEFARRAAFALLWGLSVHDKSSGDDRFARSLLLVEGAAGDDRNFVKKAVNMALRAVGKRSPPLHAAAVSAARKLAASSSAAARWVGKNALAELTGAAVARRLSKAADAAAAPSSRKAR